MSESTIWWLLAGLAVGTELLTGTFHLLMIAVGLAAGAIAAHAGAGLAAQLVSAALVGGGSVVAWHLTRRRQAAARRAGADPDINLDVGEPVQVERWAADHTAVVRYRGANWTAVPFDGAPQGPGTYRVRAISGSRLVVEKI